LLNLICFYFYIATGKRDPSKDKLWVKVWETTNDEVTFDPLATALYRQAQKVSTAIADAVYQQLLTHPERTPLISYTGGKVRLVERNNVWLAPDAIHYQAGIDSIPCLDTEFAIKIDKDFTNVITELHYIIKRVRMHYSNSQGIIDVNVNTRYSVNRLMITKNKENFPLT